MQAFESLKSVFKLQVHCLSLHDFCESNASLRRQMDFRQSCSTAQLNVLCAGVQWRPQLAIIVQPATTSDMKRKALVEEAS